MNDPAIALAILQLTDLHLYATTDGTLFAVNTNYSFHAVLAHARTHTRFDMMCLTGDLVHDESAEGYQRLAATLLELNKPVICMPGNHDDACAINQYLNVRTVKAIDHVVVNGWLLVFLDTAEPGKVAGFLAAERLARLQALFADYYHLPALIFTHHPPVDIGSAWMDQIKLTNSADFFAVIDQFPTIRGVICGHIHQELDVMRGSVRYLGTPSTCVQFKPRSEKFALGDQHPGYRCLTLYADGTLGTEVCRVPDLQITTDIKAPGY